MIENCKECENPTCVEEKVDNVIQLPVQPSIPVQDEKIVIFQLVSPNSCLFLCLSADETNNRLDVGIITR